MEPERIELSSREVNAVLSTCLVNFGFSKKVKGGDTLSFLLVAVSYPRLATSRGAALQNDTAIQHLQNVSAER